MYFGLCSLRSSLIHTVSINPPRIPTSQMKLCNQSKYICWVPTICIMLCKKPAVEGGGREVKTIVSLLTGFTIYSGRYKNKTNVSITRDKGTAIQQCRNFFPFIFNWRIIALQCCISVCCTAEWISYMYTYIPCLLDLPPTQPHLTVQKCWRQ